MKAGVSYSCYLYGIGGDPLKNTVATSVKDACGRFRKMFPCSPPVARDEVIYTNRTFEALSPEEQDKLLEHKTPDKRERI